MATMLDHPQQTAAEHEAARWAETDPAALGSVLAAVRARYAWNRHDLARWLGVSLGQLGALALEPLAAHPMPEDSAEALAARYAADPARLAFILARREYTATRRQPSDS